MYDMIFKRKSFRRFDDTLALSNEELQKIEQQLYKFPPLVDDINLKYQIVKQDKTTCKRGEYCLLVYSEKKEDYLLNIGYVLAQLDLWMASENIGACWYGMGKTTEQQYGGLDFVIMLAFGKGHSVEFRKDYTKAKRKELAIIWNGESLVDVANVVRYAPSSCNSQPWRVFCESADIQIYRSTQVRSMIPEGRRPYFNSIDMGIFLCFMEITMKNKGYEFKRMLYAGQKKDEDEDLIAVANYRIL
ncbi:nitroreductase family protein [Desulfosporosinus nitroreducens]|nr:nitroreductase family protein [Desulfosporosinus nitroreducens]MCO1601964.1 nitroreductase [Desulfosporosinus nitroreducens]